MKCPKCGYTSFESYDSCRKCSADLVEFKQTHGLAALILPPALCASMAAELGAEQSSDNTAPENSADMFSFELPTDQQQAASTPSPASDPFSFDAPPAATPAFSFDTPPATTAQDDPFAALLENTPQPQSSPQPPPAAGFEMNSFSWDDTPTPGQPGSEPAEKGKTVDDDFNSLFGEPDGADKK